MFEGVALGQIIGWILGILGIGSVGGLLGYSLKQKEQSARLNKNYRDELREDLNRLDARLKESETREEEMRNRFFELEQEYHHLKLAYEAAKNKIAILEKQIETKVNK